MYSKLIKSKLETIYSSLMISLICSQLLIPNRTRVMYILKSTHFLSQISISEAESGHYELISYSSMYKYYEKSVLYGRDCDILV